MKMYRLSYQNLGSNYGNAWIIEKRDWTMFFTFQYVALEFTETAAIKKIEYLKKKKPRQLQYWYF